MTKDDVQDVRLDIMEKQIQKHDEVIQRLSESQLELSSRLTELASSIETQSVIIGQGFDLMKKVILGLMAILTTIGAGTQVM
jgi:hypothetical protein